MFKFISDFFDSLWMKQYRIFVKEINNQVNNGLVESRSEVEIYEDTTGRPRKDLSVMIDYDEHNPTLFAISLGAYGEKHAKEKALANLKIYKHLHNIDERDHINERYGVPITSYRNNPPRGGSGFPSLTFVNTAHSTREVSPQTPGDVLQIRGRSPALFISPDGLNWNQVRSQNSADPTTIKELKEKATEQIDPSRKLVVFKNDTV